MVNHRRVEQKLPILITDGPWYTSELDRNIYRITQFKKRDPTRFQQHKNQIIMDLEKLRRDVDKSVNGKQR